MGEGAASALSGTSQHPVLLRVSDRTNRSVYIPQGPVVRHCTDATETSRVGGADLLTSAGSPASGRGCSSLSLGSMPTKGDQTS